MVSGSGVTTDLLASFKAEPADVVVVDCLLYRALADSVAAALPAVQLMHTLWSFNRANTRGAVGLVCRIRGVNAGRAIAGAGLTLVTTRPEFDSGNWGPGVEHTGFVWQGEPVAATPRDTPRVLVSFSTTSFPGQLEAMQNTIDGLAELDA
ncbi:MAG: hypothetical protein KF742_04430 [Cryobacterium sp.]|nr:hypothetical protein [Cryobacterium sp.]